VIWRISGSRCRRLAHRRLSAAGQAGKACWSRTAISFSTSGTGTWVPQLIGFLVHVPG
jgi:hypothetical protein